MDGSNPSHPLLSEAGEDDTRQKFNKTAFLAIPSHEMRVKHLRRFFPNLHVEPLLQRMAREGKTLGEFYETVPAQAGEVKMDFEFFAQYCRNGNMLEPKKDSQATRAILFLCGFERFEDLTLAVWEERYKRLKLKNDGPFADALVVHMAKTGKTAKELCAALPPELRVAPTGLSNLLKGHITPYHDKRIGHSRTGVAVAHIVQQDVNVLFTLDAAPPIAARGTAKPKVAQQVFSETVYTSLPDEAARFAYLFQHYKNIHALPLLKVMARDILTLRDIAAREGDDAEHALNRLKLFCSYQPTRAQDVKRDSKALASILAATQLTYEGLMEAVWEERLAYLLKTYPSQQALPVLVHMAKTGETAEDMVARLPPALAVKATSFRSFLSGVNPPWNRTKTGPSKVAIAAAFLIGQEGKADELFLNPPADTEERDMRSAAPDTGEEQAMSELPALEPQEKGQQSSEASIKQRFPAPHARRFIEYMVHECMNLRDVATRLCGEKAARADINRKERQIEMFLADVAQAYDPVDADLHSPLCREMCWLVNVTPHGHFPLRLHPLRTSRGQTAARPQTGGHSAREKAEPV